jgi:protein-S-isoprenylcysteine O-methyltransferase Ste14
VTHSARGTSRAERRRRAQARQRGSWLAQLPYAAVVIGVAAGLLWMRGDQRDVRSGTLVMAGVLLAGAAARLGLPERRAGLLGSRRRLADAAAFAALGAGLLVAGLIFPVPA